MKKVGNIMCKSIIKQINDNGEITEHSSYTLEPFKALVCYLEQTINNNYKTWDYFKENFKDALGREYQTKSKYIDLIKEMPSKKGYAYSVPNTNTVICALSQ